MQYLVDDAPIRAVTGPLIESVKPSLLKQAIQIRTSEFLILTHLANSNYQQPGACSLCVVPKKSGKDSASYGTSGTPLAAPERTRRQSEFILKRTDSESRTQYVLSIQQLQIGSVPSARSP
jgi:hypothetical protein